MTPTEQLADLTARLKQAEAERDAFRSEVESVKAAHGAYIQRIRDGVGMVTPGDGFYGFIMQLKADKDAAIAKLAEAEKELQRLEENNAAHHRDYADLTVENARLSYQRDALQSHLNTLRTALEQYADPGNWHVGSKYDGESRSFTGPDEARKALDATERGDGL